MRKEFNEILDFCREVLSSIEKSASRAEQQIPLFVTSQIKAINRKNASSGLGMSEGSFAEYLDALDVTVTGGGMVVIEIDPEPWLPNALEGGIKPFDLKETHLRKNFKTSKNGYRYKVIPMKAGKNSGTFFNPQTKKRESNRPGGTTADGAHVAGYSNRSKAIRKQVDAALKSPKWTSPRTAPLKNNGQIARVSKLDTGNSKFPGLKKFGALGLYKVETFRDSEHEQSGTSPSKKPSYIMFRTITDNPAKSAGKWQHPGILPRDILGKLSISLDKELDKYIDDIIDEEFSWLDS
ncbi:hypothetical protein UFOVP244_19 [uncultured Caudovirales phage]|uniref:Uncharacterized protein n=1 Tax=uncultured Caudovirales phage TaxID=2100421 RepID=A0A6J7WV06_9CAUD|nr:hypothetical protein UFOVP244_19 [uncultured Caudovirales phage]